MAQELVSRLTRAVDHSSARHVLIGTAEMECPLHLGRHAGGTVLSGSALQPFTPVLLPAGGVKVTPFDHDGAEDIGLVKLDVLAHRMRDSISEAVSLIRRRLDPGAISWTASPRLTRSGRAPGSPRSRSRARGSFNS